MTCQLPWRSKVFTAKQTSVQRKSQNFSSDYQSLEFVSYSYPPPTFISMYHTCMLSNSVFIYKSFGHTYNVIEI